MKIVQLNTTCGSGSTGKICAAVSALLTKRGIENYVLYTQGNSDLPGAIKYTTEKYKKTQALKSRVLGNYGFNSRRATKALIQHLENIRPDVVHIHNIHGHDCDLTMLFQYLKGQGTKVFWTFHDCWAFTGYCPYFDMAECNKWQTGCNNCPQAKRFSWFFDRSKTMYQRKKELFFGLNMTIITPSQWLANTVKKSFLKDYPVKVINNGIDLNIFKPTPGDFRVRHHCVDKFVLLGVAFGWDARKGLDVFVEMAKRLDSRFQVVLVGLDKETDKQLPQNIISIHRTQNQTELAEIYTAADLFVNPTREEVLGLVNIESLACGTPGVTYDSGGSPECYDETCGAVVGRNDVDALESEIIRICTEKPFSEAMCLKRAQEFDQPERYKEYVDFYETATSENQTN